MPIDLRQFHQTYFEECFENLQVMESGMLDLSGGDPEQINIIFRAAHSIKGGSATFGFEAIARFTHQLETLLDEMRKGSRPADREVIDLLLRSVDCLREMIRSSQQGAEFDQERVVALNREYELLKAPPTSTPKARDNDREIGAVGPSTGWRIRLKPRRRLFCTGNDPVRLFRVLQDLGALKVHTDCDRLPPFPEMDPEVCYLSWDLTLEGNASRESVLEVFEWLEGDCDLEIAPLVGQESGARLAIVPSAADPAPSAAPAPVAAIAETPDKGAGGQERRSGVDRRSAMDRRQEGSSIRVSIEKIDALINTVGELVITQAMLSQLGENFDMAKLDRLRDGLDQLERNTHQLQESVMGIRMLPISGAFNRFPRMVHDLSEKLGKKVELQMSGEQTELDKTVMERITDPLTHLVRNCLDHAIETPEARIAAGKPETGVIRLSAYHKGGNICIEVEDDGAGIDRERILKKAQELGIATRDEEITEQTIIDLIFLPGVSSAETVSDISGRGVGMDVVRRNIRELQGQLEVRSRRGQGTTVLIRLPLTLAILEGQLVRIGREKCIIPLVSISESLEISTDCASRIAGQAELYTLRGSHIPIVRVAETFGFPVTSDGASESLLVVVEGEGERIGLVVDELLGQQQVVIKSLETNFKRIEGISGATILGDGSVALIIDVAGVIALSRRVAQSSGIAATRVCERQRQPLGECI